MVPGIIDLGVLDPDTVSTLEEARAATLYGEVGATGTAQVGGVTFNFVGTGSSVCLWVDPETVYWSQSVGRQGGIEKWSYPDNMEDDGDIDMFAGVSVYYSGSPGVEIGGFEVRYQDALGNEIPVQFNECEIESVNITRGAHAGRGMAEHCQLSNTQLGVDYTVVLETFSPPSDDNRLGYGLLFTDGPCLDLETIVSNDADGNDECLITGESIDPRNDHDYREQPFLVKGADAVADFTWVDSTKFEGLFCLAAGAGTVDEGTLLRDYCLDEADLIVDRRDCDREEVRCFCGDLDDTPAADN